ncbi:MAG: hypothetical protein ACI3VZ_00565 [Faecousia sp.]
MVNEVFEIGQHCSLFFDSYGKVPTAIGNTYTYGNASWADLLTAYNGHAIAYEGQTLTSETSATGTVVSGNPVSYYNGTRWNFTWEGSRRLTSASSGGNTISFTYDVNGLRTSKTVNGTLHTYYYAGGRLLRETYGNNILDFAYDANGNPFSLTYNGAKYYYITNTQGDVFYLINTAGTVVASYTYDPYGKVLSASGSPASINPCVTVVITTTPKLASITCNPTIMPPQICRFLLPLFTDGSCLRVCTCKISDIRV